jgi:lipopolysaccharide/colanic/teichoic acid biosynthesis glycosyltransferase
MIHRDWPHALAAVFTPTQMRVVLHRERMRADRTNTQVAAVLFELSGGSGGNLQRLARLVVARARVTDDVGWASSDQLCVVLPETAVEGAHRFANSVCDVAAKHRLDVRYTLYTNGRDDPPDRGGHGDGPRSIAALPPSSHPTPAQTLSPRLYATVGGDHTSMPLEMLLHEPMPAWKRATDVVGASLALIIAAPVLAVSAALIKISSRGPVLFRQWRAGLYGRRFSILKFRTMVPDAERLKAALRPMSEQDGPAFKMKNDPRVTIIGKWLRRTSLDELPQLWNVLKGHMSLVGPRPLPVQEADGCQRWQRRRLDVMPGLTCIWQVRGRSQVAFDDWMRMDMEYIRRRSFLYDLKLLLLTLPAVLLHRGAH